MPSMTFSIPDRLLSRIDKIVKEKGLSRNRLIIEACEPASEKDAGQWPEGFFDDEPSRKDLKLLRVSAKEMEQVVLKACWNRKELKE